MHVDGAGGGQGFRECRVWVLGYFAGMAMRMLSRNAVGSVVSVGSFQ